MKNAIIGYWKIFRESGLKKDIWLFYSYYYAKYKLKSAKQKSKIQAFKEYEYEIRTPPHPHSKEMTIAIAQRWGSLSGYDAAEAFEIVFSRTRNIGEKIVPI